MMSYTVYLKSFHRLKTWVSISGSHGAVDAMAPASLAQS